MKAWVYTTKDLFEKNPKVTIVDSISDLLEILDKHKDAQGLIISRVNKDKTDILVRNRPKEYFDCDIEVEIYDDYRE